MALDLKKNIKAIPQATPYNLTTAPAPELPERAGVLSQRLQELARNYVGARQKTGESLLESARWLSEARQEAKHGDWRLFLDATGTSDDTAERLLNIHAQAIQNPQFAESVRTQWIGQSAAALLALSSTPPEIIDQVLNAPEPMKVAEIRDAIKEAKRPAPADQSMLPNMPAPPAITDLPPEFAIVQRRLAAHGIELLSNIQGHHRAFVTRRQGMTGVVTFDWADVLSKLERLEAEPPPGAPEKLPAHLTTCIRCGSERTLYRQLTSYQAGLVEEYPGRAVTLCSRCIPELLAARKNADESAAPAQPKIPEVAPTIESLDATLPRSLSDAGFYWKVADPPTIAHNDGWYTTAATVEAALNLAHDRAQERVEATDRWLTPGAHAQAVSLLVSIRTDLITDQIDSAERHTRQLLAVIEKGED